MTESALGAAIREFLTYLREVRQLSPHTLTNYQRDLNALLLFCDAAGLYEPDAVQESHIRQWVTGMHRKGLAGSSIQRSLSACRSLYNHLGRQAGQPRNPAAAVQAPRKPRKLPKTLDADQLDHFLSKSDDSPLGLRDLAIAELFYSSGLRLAELSSLNIHDIDRNGRLVTVTGKGSKTRTVPVGQAALTAIDNWLAQRPAPAPDSDCADALFRRACDYWAARRACARMFTPICSGTPLPAICWNPVATCGPYKSYWGTRISPQRRYTRIWISSTWPRSTMRHTPGPDAANPNRSKSCP